MRMKWSQLLLPLLVRTNTAQQYQCRNDLERIHDGEEKHEFKRFTMVDRYVYVYTPAKYDRTTKSKVLLAFHDWGEDGKTYTTDSRLKHLADKHNYVIVAPDGQAGENELLSWSFSGSSDGIGSDGKSVTTCNEDAVGGIDGRSDYCEASCAPCKSKCGWTHCLDDDVQFVQDFITGNTGSDSLSDLVCFDPDGIFALGISNGGMFTWELGQNPISAPYVKGIAPIIGLPLCDYNFPQAEGFTVPAISITGEYDTTVMPSKPPFPGSSANTCVTNRDGEEFIYITSHRITTTWAEDETVTGCTVPDRNRFPQDIYEVPGFKKESIKCRTWCKEAGTKAHSVDCNMVKTGHNMNTDAYKAAYKVALSFFDTHFGVVPGVDCSLFTLKNVCNNDQKCYWSKKTKKRCKDAPGDQKCAKYSKKGRKKKCQRAGCVWNGFENCISKYF